MKIVLFCVEAVLSLRCLEGKRGILVSFAWSGSLLVDSSSQSSVPFQSLLFSPKW
jgi:hypothetical protein